MSSPRADVNGPVLSLWFKDMLSQTVEYALRAVVHLAQDAPEPQKIAEIAATTQVPPVYLSKVLQGLRAKEIVRLQRGVGGGVTLAASPANLPT
jgi:Rrf2 family nitric oxide-sensitive transcriptional repressor